MSFREAPKFKNEAIGETTPAKLTPTEAAIIELYRDKKEYLIPRARELAHSAARYTSFERHEPKLFKIAIGTIATAVVGSVTWVVTQTGAGALTAVHSISEPLAIVAVAATILIFSAVEYFGRLRQRELNRTFNMRTGRPDQSSSSPVQNGLPDTSRFSPEALDELEKFKTIAWPFYYNNYYTSSSEIKKREKFSSERARSIEEGTLPKETPKQPVQAAPAAAVVATEAQIQPAQAAPATTTATAQTQAISQATTTNPTQNLKKKVSHTHRVIDWLIHQKQLQIIAVIFTMAYIVPIIYPALALNAITNVFHLVEAFAVVVGVISMLKNFASDYINKKNQFVSSS